MKRRIIRRKRVGRKMTIDRLGWHITTLKERLTSGVQLKRYSFDSNVHIGHDYDFHHDRKLPNGKVLKKLADVDLVCKKFPRRKGVDYHFIGNDIEVTCRDCKKIFNIATNS